MKHTEWIMKKRTIISNMLMIVSFCIIILALFFQNIGTFWGQFSSTWKKYGDMQRELLNVETEFQQSVEHRTDFINLYGLALNAINERIVGEYDFVKGDYGIIQRFESFPDLDGFLSSINELEALTEQMGIPLVYVTEPDKAAGFALADSDEFAFNGQLSGYAGEMLKEKVEVFDVAERMETDKDAPAFKDFFLRTDVHLSTCAEFWIAKALAEYLTQAHGLAFADMETVFDLKNYEVNGYEFLGNTARSAGEFFVKTDTFEQYIPQFETRLALINPPDKVTREGDYVSVMMNGYHEQKYANKYTYWVTNYAQYPSPYYQYINLNVTEDAPKVLVIGDSIFLRGLTFLALASRKLTVIDPRTFDGTDYLANELAVGDYDAVIVFGSAVNFFSCSFKAHIDLPDLPNKRMDFKSEYVDLAGSQGVYIDTCNRAQVLNRDVFSVQSDVEMIELCGWAVDFESSLPLTELYLQIGDAVLKCRYGIEQENVKAEFENENLLKTGFQVTFPAKCLRDLETTEISLIGVSSDKQYLYTPVVYQISRQ